MAERNRRAKLGAHYMLRRNLPLWKAQDTIAEAIAFAKKVGIAEIIWKVDAEDFNHGFTPLELLRKYAAWLEKARDAQAREGIIFSINPWVTLNHAHRARYAAGPPKGFHWRVRPDGAEALERACPLSSGWRGWVLAAYRLYATTRPDKLWLEDDFKTFAEGGAELGCYCPAHLAAFALELGEKLSRETLVERITRPGDPDPVRARWLDFQGRIMVEIAREIERVVHEESPSTRLGLMQSWSTDGRWWEEAIRALAGPLRPLARTSLAPYGEGRAIGFLPDNFDILKETACLPPGTENCPELENSVYTSYSKSARMTRFQILLGQVLGNRAVTMNLFDMVGSPLSDEPRLAAMLKKLKPMIDAIAGVAPAGGTPRGVSTPYPKRYADDVRLKPGEGFDGFRFRGEGWLVPLQGSGIPVFLNADARVHALTGQSARSLRAPEIERLLQGGLLLDGSAARTLQDLGFGHLVGVDVGEPLRREGLLLGAERMDDVPAPEGDPCYVTMRSVTADTAGSVYPLSLSPRARGASTFVDNEHRELMTAFALFENDLGGRVATYALDLSSGVTTGFMSWRRRSQLQRVVRWLARDRVDLFVDGGAWMMPVRRDYPGCSFVAALNFETDGWDKVTLTFEHRGKPEGVRFEILRSSGRFAQVRPSALRKDGPNVIATFRRPVAPLDAVVFRVSRRSS
ncbi:MAG: hypothetical protein V2A58_02445 [Planctomycetota bacterium]